MNWLDWCLGILLAGSIAAGFLRGFSRQVVGFVSAIAALFLGIWFYGAAGSFLLPYVSSKGVANFCGFVLVFISVLIVGALFGYLLGRLVKAAGLTFVDRVMGMGFGVVRGLLLAIALILAIMAFTPGARPPAAVVDSRLAPYVIDAARACSAIAPYELKQGFYKSYDQVKGIWHESFKKGIRGLPSAKKIPNEREI